MIREDYTPELSPPAPFVLVTLRSSVSSAEVKGVLAQIDTAADRSVVPSGVLDALGVQPIDTVTIAGVGGTREEMYVFAVAVHLGGTPGRVIGVVGHAGESWMLLGRDVLNGFRIVLDGPNLTLEIA